MNTSLQGPVAGRWRLAAVFLFVAMLVACGGGTEQPKQGAARYLAAAAKAVDNPEGVVISGLQLKVERRISRTVFEYEYEVQVRNDGAALKDFVAQITSSGPGTTIIDGRAALASLPAGATTALNDRVVLRQDRTMPFQPASLAWHLSGSSGIVSALPGAPSDPALNAIVEFDSDPPFPGNEFEMDGARGAPVLRSKVVFGLVEGATVGQVNALLQSLNAEIVRSYEKTAVLEVRIADPGSLAALDDLLETLRGHPVVGFALPVSLEPANALPEPYLGQNPPALDYVAHQLSVKAAATWNARRAVEISGRSSGPVLLVADYFGNGTPADSLNAWLPAQPSHDGFLTWELNPHGYHVLGIAAASFGPAGGTSSTEAITGIYSAGPPLSVDVTDLTFWRAFCDSPERERPCSGKTTSDRLRSLLQLHANSGRKVVLNTSLGYNGPDTGLTISEADAQKEYWLLLIRGGHGNVASPLENLYFHAAAAGNRADLPARQNIGWTRAAIDGFLLNTAVVENRVHLLAPPYSPACLAANSSFGGNLSAIGANPRAHPNNGVWSYGSAEGTPRRLGGTSMASPQVAGLAALFWAIRDDLTGPQLLRVMTGHAVPAPTPCRADAPVIDTYATVLAADDPEALLGPMGDPAKAPVRMAILDVDQDGEFTNDDARAFVDAFVASAGGSAFVPIRTRTVAGRTVDMSRFDLNAEGNVGGAGTARFNLDVDYDAERKSRYGMVRYEPVRPQLVELDENAVTDFQILCYYIHSPLRRDSKGTLADLGQYLSSQGLSCIGPLVGVEIRIADLNTGWGGLPATIRMSQLYPVSRIAFQLVGNSATCGSQGQPLGERGSPLFSNSVDANALFHGARVVTGVPYQLSSGAPNLNNCSSFFAYKAVQVDGELQPLVKLWANATGRTVFGFSGPRSDWEYQVRYYSGDPELQYSDKKVSVGLVANSGVYVESFRSVQNSLSYLLGPPVQ
ncbi:S8 family serine peptidase [Pseudoduganella albidiflava]|uniref:Peptidase S8/S53 domain-containing protein n=1 Tax=Pseudoduganella albidiflava TaxID=321983 RepID=A0A411X256_9BURK|nr:S8 family serine peptidase [Pseudoduganella albidiflava]QBI03049.1 hypothetical protein EYF70_21055 [Pseudoduganella albidiflava]GGY58551.1 hypothetical protein GCM10007387_46370 [Pseudoduganella albidiflava]